MCIVLQYTNTLNKHTASEKPHILNIHAYRRINTSTPNMASFRCCCCSVLLFFFFVDDGDMCIFEQPTPTGLAYAKRL